jgi:hypothetical protein
MSGETEEEARAPSRAGSMASSVFSGRTAESSYATEALSAEMKAELVKIILYRKMTGTMRESRTVKIILYRKMTGTMRESRTKGKSAIPGREHDIKRVQRQDG